MISISVLLPATVTRRALQKLIREEWPSRSLADGANPHPTVAHPDEPPRVVVYRMAESGLTRFPVVAPDDHGKLLSMVSLYDLLWARTCSIEVERHRERVLRIRLPFGSWSAPRAGVR